MNLNRGRISFFDTRNGKQLPVMLILLLILSFLTVYPLVMLLYGSLNGASPGEQGTFSLRGYTDLFTAKNGEILFNTLSISLIKTVISLVVATIIAFLVARTDMPFKGSLEILLALPFFIPPVLTAMAWGMLANEQVGTLNLVWFWLTGSNQSIFNMYSYAGVIWHMVQYSIPFLYLMLINAFRAMDPSLEESSRTSGAGRWRTFWKITLALMLPAMTSAFLLSFLRGVESFESPVIFGTPVGIKVLTTQIFYLLNEQAVSDTLAGTSMACATVAILFLLVVLQWWLLRGKSFQTVTGKGFTPQLVPLGQWRWIATGFCFLLFAITVILPISQLILSSFSENFGFYSWDTFTLKHYQEVFQSDIFWRALRNTMVLAFSASTVVMILSAVIGYAVVRTNWRFRKVIDLLAWLPWLMPGMVLALGLLWGYAWLPKWIGIYGTVWALFLAYLALGSPLGVRVMSDAFRQISTDIEESSRVHGASFFRTFWCILVVLAWPSFVVGWIFTFFMVLRELAASILLYAPGNEVLSTVMFRMWSDGKAEQVSVVGIIMLVPVLGLFAARYGLIDRRKT